MIAKRIKLISNLFLVKVLFTVGLIASAFFFVKRKYYRLSGHNVKVVTLNVLLFAQARMFNFARGPRHC